MDVSIKKHCKKYTHLGQVDRRDLTIAHQYYSMHDRYAPKTTRPGGLIRHLALGAGQERQASRRAVLVVAVSELVRLCGDPAIEERFGRKSEGTERDKGRTPIGRSVHYLIIHGAEDLPTTSWTPPPRSRRTSSHWVGGTFFGLIFP